MRLFFLTLFALNTSFLLANSKIDPLLKLLREHSISIETLKKNLDEQSSQITNFLDLDKLDEAFNEGVMQLTDIREPGIYEKWRKWEKQLQELKSTQKIMNPIEEEMKLIKKRFPEHSEFLKILFSEKERKRREAEINQKKAQTFQKFFETICNEFSQEIESINLKEILLVLWSEKLSDIFEEKKQAYELILKNISE